MHYDFSGLRKSPTVRLQDMTPSVPSITPSTRVVVDRQNRAKLRKAGAARPGSFQVDIERLGSIASRLMTITSANGGQPIVRLPVTGS